MQKDATKKKQSVGKVEPTDPIKLTLELVKIPSVSTKSGGDELGVAQYAGGILEKEGFKVKYQEVAEGRQNVVATIGKPKIILQSHIDTVAGNPEAKETDDYVYGRGSCDAKGSVASMMSAAIELAREGRKDFGVVLTVGEENGFVGVKEARKLVSPKYVVIGEPTGLQGWAGHSGMLQIELIANGRSFHVGNPEKPKDINAIDKMDAITGEIRSLKLPFNKVLGQTTLEVTLKEGGTRDESGSMQEAHNIVPNFARAVVDIRPSAPTSEILPMIDKIVERHKGCSYRIINISEPTSPPKQERVLNLALQMLPGKYTGEEPFWEQRDIPANERSGIAPIVFYCGPSGGGPDNGPHSEGERVSKSELLLAKRMYKEMIQTALSE